MRMAAEGEMSWRAALDSWRTAIMDAGGADPMAEVLDRERGRDEAFPWECIDLGLDRAYLFKEWERFGQARASAPCPALSGGGACGDCVRCGVGAWLTRDA